MFWNSGLTSKEADMTFWDKLEVGKTYQDTLGNKIKIVDFDGDHYIGEDGWTYSSDGVACWDEDLHELDEAEWSHCHLVAEVPKDA
jgi:hypothetical protein